jgi:hypothetical protein
MSLFFRLFQMNVTFDGLKIDTFLLIVSNKNIFGREF